MRSGIALSPEVGIRFSYTIYRLPRGKVPFASDGVEIAFLPSDTNFFAISPFSGVTQTFLELLRVLQTFPELF